MLTLSLFEFEVEHGYQIQQFAFSDRHRQDSRKFELIPSIHDDVTNISREDLHSHFEFDKEAFFSSRLVLVFDNHNDNEEESKKTIQLSTDVLRLDRLSIVFQLIFLLE